MRSNHLFAMCFSLQCLVLVHAQQRPRPLEPPNPDPARLPPTPASPDGQPAPKADVPGAIAVGHEPYIAPSVDKTDVGEIGKQLSELVDKIASAIKHQTSSTTITTAITNYDPLRTPLSACYVASNYYDLCSSSFANFTTLPRTQQAGCLCNVYEDSNFNGLMNSCYSYLAPNNQTRTQYAAYATAVSSGISLCASTQSTPVATAAPVSSPTAPTPTTSPNGAASRVYGSFYCATFLAFGLTLLLCALF